jgi:hypothetical protein
VATLTWASNGAVLGDDVFAGGRVRDRAAMIQKKTGRAVQFEITEQTRNQSANGWRCSAAADADISFRAVSENSRLGPLLPR